MNKNRTLLNELKSKIAEDYSRLRNENPVIIIEDEEDYESYFEVRNDISGETYDVHVQKVDSTGIHCVKANDTSSQIVIGLNDLASIEDRMILVEIMTLKTI